MKLIRRLIFWVFCLIYVILCPLIVLSSLGYVFSSKQQEMVHTGILALSTVPKDATVYLGKSRYAYKTPTVLRDLLPGQYSVRLVKKGHRSWEQSVKVVAGQALTFDKILLLPQWLNALERVAGSIKEFIPVEGTNFIVIARDERLEDYFVYDITREKLRRFIPSSSPYCAARVLSVVSVADSPVLFLTVELNRQRRYLWMKIRDTKTRLVDISALFPEEPSQVSWDPDDEARLFSLQKDWINRLDISAKALVPRFIENVRGFGISNRTLVYLTGDKLIKKVRYDRPAADVLGDGLELKRSFMGDAGVARVQVMGVDETAVLLKNRQLFVFTDAGMVEAEDIEGMQYDRDEKKLLIWGREKAGVIDLEKGRSNEDELARMQARWVYSGGRNIEQCCWVYAASHILVKEREDVSLVELASPGQPGAVKLLSIRRDSPLMYVDDMGAVYYIDKATGALSSVDIVPRKQFLPLAVTKPQEPSGEIEE